MWVVEEFRQEFLAESFEGLDRMERCLTELETSPGNEDLLGEIFRAVHTMKGSTGFMGYARVERLAHAGENVIGAVRNGSIKATTEVVSGLLQVMDALRAVLRGIEQTGQEVQGAGDEDVELLALLVRLANGAAAKAEPAIEAGVRAADQGVTAASAVPSERTLRIDVDVLNRMMNLVGELVLTRNQILRSGVDTASFPELARRLDCVTADLRETVMQARMQPVGQLFGKFPRMVRDLALGCGKQVALELSGQETGLDRSLLEAIKDPLTHAVRNAVDHGIELPEARVLAGKPKQGTIGLCAYQRNGSVVIELTDDGAGISLSRVRTKAVERGLVTAAQAAAMSEQEAMQLIFRPGFSTAASVTHLSGRGVGMDVVKNNVERVGGTVELDSHEGAGTVLRMRVPLTLAIMPALVVESGGQSFCVPQSALVGLVHVPWDEAEQQVEQIGDAEVYRLRESLLPMVWLDRVLAFKANERKRLAHGFYIALLELDRLRFGLAVDQLMAPEEIVVKPLTCGLREIGLFSGATVLGDGGLAMILDVPAVAARAGVTALAKQPAVLAKAAEQEHRPQLLVFQGRGLGQKAEQLAMPLEAVERVEHVELRSIEYVRGRPILRQEESLLALEDASGLLEELADADGSVEVSVLICRRSRGQEQTERIGLVVRGMLDVTHGSALHAVDGMQLDESALDKRLALVNGRVATVCNAFAGALSMQEVA